MLSEIQKMFLGDAPNWYKSTIIGFLIFNPILLAILNISMPEEAGFILGWIFLLQFIFTLAMALKCYPLQPGGLLAIEAVILGLTSTETIYYEISQNLKVILLLIMDRKGGLTYIPHLYTFEDDLKIECRKLSCVFKSLLNSS